MIFTPALSLTQAIINIAKVYQGVDHMQASSVQGLLAVYSSFLKRSNLWAYFFL